MNRYRWLTIGLSAALAVLVIGVIIVASSDHSAPSSGSASVVSPPSAGPFRTGSSLPAALAKRPVPQFDLADARGGRFASRSLKGHAYVITFLYVHCVDVCPLIGSEIHQALTDLGPAAKQLPVVAISVDPRGDTRTAVDHWLKLHQEPANFHYLIGSTQALTPIWKAFFVAPQIPDDPHSSHTAIIWLVNRVARVAALIPAGLPINTNNLARDFTVLQQQ